MRCPHGFERGLGLCEDCEGPTATEARPRPLRKCERCGCHRDRDRIDPVTRICRGVCRESEVWGKPMKAIGDG